MRKFKTELESMTEAYFKYMRQDAYISDRDDEDIEGIKVPEDLQWDDMHEESQDKIKAECKSFYEKIWPMFEKEESNLDAKRFGELFYLNRCESGIGFWDNYGEDWSDQLAKIASEEASLYHKVYLYMGDDGIGYYWSECSISSEI